MPVRGGSGRLSRVSALQQHDEATDREDPRRADQLRHERTLEQGPASTALRGAGACRCIPRRQRADGHAEHERQQERAGPRGPVHDVRVQRSPQPVRLAPLVSDAPTRSAKRSIAWRMTCARRSLSESKLPRSPGFLACASASAVLSIAFPPVFGMTRSAPWGHRSPTPCLAAMDTPRNCLPRRCGRSLRRAGTGSVVVGTHGWTATGLVAAPVRGA